MLKRLSVTVLLAIAVAMAFPTTASAQERCEDMIILWHSDTIWVGQSTIAYSFTADTLPFKCGKISQMTISTDFGDIEFIDDSSNSGRFRSGTLLTDKGYTKLKVVSAMCLLDGKPYNLLPHLTFDVFQRITLSK